MSYARRAATALLCAGVLAGCAERIEPPDASGRIAFVRRTEDAPVPNRELYIMRSDGSDIRRITYSAYDEERVLWVPGGPIVFDRSTEGANSYNHEIFSIMPDGSGERRLTYGFDDLRVSALLPDGRIMFTRTSIDGYLSVFAMAVDGSGSAPYEWCCGVPLPSPDGRLYAVRRPGGLSVARPDGSDLRPILEGSIGSLSWSPDSTRIVTSLMGSIAVAEADGSGTTTLFDDGTATNPSWSPDGTTIAFVRWLEGTVNSSQIWVMKADGSNAQPITSGDFEDSQPVWEPADPGS